MIIHDVLGVGKMKNKRIPFLEKDKLVAEDLKNPQGRPAWLEELRLKSAEFEKKRAAAAAKKSTG